MRIEQFNDVKELGERALGITMEEIVLNPKLLVCAATGNSPLPLYQGLAQKALEQVDLFKNMRIIALDEWVGLDDPEDSCDAFIQKELIAPLKISPSRYFGFNGNSPNLNQECLRIQNILNQEGPIDLCILGLGKNGHLGFNEPASVLQPHCHIAELSSISQQHSMVKTKVEKPTTGLTLGIEDILASKRIILIVSGNGKDEAKKQLLSSKSDPHWPATFLWKHHNTDCLWLNEE